MMYARPALIVIVALALAGCCCGPSSTGARRVAGESAASTGRLFVVVRATLLDPTEEGRRQVLVEASVVAVSSEGSVDAIDQAQRLEVDGAPTWLAATQDPDAAFGPGSRVEQKPSIVTQAENEATIQVGESTGDGSARNMSELRVTPTFDAEGALTLALRFEQYDHGRLTHAVPQTRLSGPAGRTIIVEALPAR